jgi:hypothetical protein
VAVTAAVAVVAAAQQAAVAVVLLSAEVSTAPAAAVDALTPIVKSA